MARISLSVWLEPRIKRLLAEEQFDVIHLHEPLAPVIPLYILRLSDAVNVGTFHAFHGSGRVYWASKYMLRRWHSRLDGRIAVSTPALSMVSRHFPGDYRVIPNGIEFSRFATPARPLTDFQDGKLNILFVGRLEKRKGLKYLLGAYSKLKWRYPNTRLIVVGPGNPEPEVFRFIAERNLEDVVLVGGVSYEDLPRYYQAADIFCSPSHRQGELRHCAAGGHGVRQAHRSHQHRGLLLRDVARRGGLLVPPRSEEALQVALETLIADPALREEMGARGALKAPRYDWERVTAQIIDYYTYLLERRGAGQSADLAEPREDPILP